MLIFSIQSISAANIAVHPGESIQNAVNGANDGDNITVYDNNNPYTYKESITLNKKITIKASGNVTIEAKNSSSAVFTVNSAASGSTIQNFIMTKTDYCIMINNANSCTIANNIISRTSLVGIQFYGNVYNSKVTGNTITGVDPSVGNGVSFEYGTVSNNTITGNTISNFLNGIIFNDNSANNTVSNNRVSCNSYSGVGIYTTDNARGMIITGNTVTGAEDGIAVQQIGTSTATNFVMTGNILTGNKNGFWVCLGNSTISNNTASGNLVSGLDITGSYNRILNNNASKNGNCGITLGSYGNADYNTVSGNILGYNQAGLNTASHYSTITGNNLSNNNNYGVIITADHVKLAQNTLENNTDGGILLIGVYNTVDSNNIYKNSVGIVLQSSGTADYNMVSNNVLNYNNNGINSGSPYSTFINNTINNCLENGLVNTADHVNITKNRVENSNGTGILSIGTYNLIKENTLTNNSLGICLQKSTTGDYNSVTGNNASNNGNGINNGSPCTELVNNTVNNNTENGMVNTASNVNIQGNSVLNNGGTGILSVGSYINIYNNLLKGNNLGIYLISFGNNDYNVLTNNTVIYNINGINSGSNGTNFYNNTLNYNNETGLTITGSNCYVVGNSMCFNKDAGLTITGTNNVVIMNRLEQNLYGASFSNYNAAVFGFNSVVGNTYQLYSPDTSGKLNAIDNWWGSNSSPANIYGLFTVSPWIVLKVVSSSNKINLNGVSNITADLTWNSAGEHTVLLYPGVFVPDGILINFSCDSLGCLSSLVLNLVNGTATTCFTGKTNGTSTIGATINNQNVSTTVIVVGGTVLAVNSTNGHKGDVVNLVATLKDGNNLALNGKTIKFWVNGNLVGTATTNGTGVASIPYTITQDPGSFTVTAQFLGDDVYTGCNGTGSLLVVSNLKNTTITLKPVSGYVGDTVNYTATLHDVDGNTISGKTVEFYVNGTSIGSSVTDSNGVANLVYKLSQSHGIYTIMAMFLQDGSYLSCNSTNSLQVNLIPTKLVVNSATAVPGLAVNLGATLTDIHNNSPLTGKVVKFFLNGVAIGTGTTNSNGLVSLVYVVLQTTGNYIISATFDGDTSYAASNNTNNLQVNLTLTNITIKPVTGYKGDKINLTATLKDKNGTPLSGKTINFYVNGTLLGTGTTNTDGTANYLCTLNSASGIYTIMAVFYQDEIYMGSNGTNSLQINLIPTNIVVNRVTGYRGCSVDLSAALKDQNNSPLVGKTVYFSINGFEVGSALTNEKGIAVLPIALIEPDGSYLSLSEDDDSYVVLAKFFENESYLASENYNNLLVKLIPSSISFNSVTKHNGTNLNLVASLKDYNNQPISGKTLEFYIGNTEVGTANTDVNGVATLVYTVSQLSRTYSFMVKFLGDDDYNETTATGYLTIVPSKTVLSVLPTNSYRTVSTNLKVKLLDEAGNGLSDKLISFFVNNCLIGTALTNSEGIATLIYTLNSCGSYNLSAEFSDNIDYNSSSDKKSWIVQTIPTKLILKSLKSYKGDKVKLQATLMNTVNNVPLSGRTVYFYVNGNLVGSGITNSSGVASYLYLVKYCSGTYSLKAEYKKDNLYGGSTNNTYLNIQKIPTKTVTNSASAKINSRIKLMATLTNLHNNTKLTNATVKFYVDGKCVGSGVSNKYGVAAIYYTVKIKRGTHNITAKYFSNNTYNGSSSYNKLKVI